MPQVVNTYWLMFYTYLAAIIKESRSKDHLAMATRIQQQCNADIALGCILPADVVESLLFVHRFLSKSTGYAWASSSSAPHVREDFKEEKEDGV